MDKQQYDHIILLVNDTVEVLFLLGIILQRSGWHNIHKASDPYEALTILETVKPDLIITDDIMPAMDGLEFIRQLRATPAYADIPIILTTVRSYKAHELIDIRFDDLIQLPLLSEGLQYFRQSLARLLNIEAPETD